MSFLSHFFLALLLAGAVLTDLRERRIPNSLTLPAWGLAIGLAALRGGAAAGGEAALGSLLGAGVWLPAMFAAAMGAGDVKLMAAAGAFLGPEGVLRAFWLTLPAGGVLAGLALAREFRRRDPLKAALGAASALALAAFGVALAVSPFPSSWLGAWGWRGTAGHAKALLFLWAVQGFALAPLVWVSWRRRRRAGGGGDAPGFSPPEARRVPYGVAIALGVGLAAWAR